jgi:hypothetical protein
VAIAAAEDITSDLAIVDEVSEGFGRWLQYAVASHVAWGETSEDALAVVKKGIAAHGVPQRLLSDNGVALNPSRRGVLRQFFHEEVESAQPSDNESTSFRHRFTQHDPSSIVVTPFLDTPAALAA